MSRFPSFQMFSAPDSWVFRFQDSQRHRECQDSQIPKFPYFQHSKIYKIPSFSNLQHPRLSDIHNPILLQLQTSRLAHFKISVVVGFLYFHILWLPESQIPRFSNCHIPRFQISRLSNFQIPDYPDYQISRLPDSQISIFPHFVISRFLLIATLVLDLDTLSRYRIPAPDFTTTICYQIAVPDSGTRFWAQNLVP